MAIPVIEFRQTEDRKLLVTCEWPSVAQISAQLVNAPWVGFGKVAPISSAEIPPRNISILADNGGATYRVRSLTAEGDFVCDLDLECHCWKDS